MEHPVGLGNESAALLAAFHISEFHPNAAVAEETDILVLVPRGKCTWKRRSNGLLVISGASGQGVTHTNEPKSGHRFIVFLVKQDRRALGIKPGSRKLEC
jgi:hypothetical protein